MKSAKTKKKVHICDKDHSCNYHVFPHHMDLFGRI